MLQEGHLEACCSIFAYLCKHPTMSLVFHPSHIIIRQDHFKSQDWMDFYGDGVKELPSDMSEPLGEAVKVTAFIDSDHAGNLVTQQSQTGYILFAIRCPSSGIARNKTQWRHRHLVRSLSLHALNRIISKVQKSFCLVLM